MTGHHLPRRPVASDVRADVAWKPPLLQRWLRLAGLVLAIGVAAAAAAAGLLLATQRAWERWLP